MSTAIAMPGNSASTFLTHFFGSGLADDRYVVERFKAHADGDIRPWPGEAPAKKRRRAKRVTATLTRGQGASPGAHRDHHLHRVADPGRDAGLGGHRDGPRHGPPAEGLGGAFPGRPAGATPAGRPPFPCQYRWRRVMGYRDPARQRAADRERFRKRTAERVAQGLCPRCGESSPRARPRPVRRLRREAQPRGPGPRRSPAGRGKATA